MDSSIHTLQRCLENICKVIRKANDVLCGISHPSVCSEVLLSAQGKSYISGVVEVYKVSKRVEGGMRTHGFVNEALQRSVKDIELLWNNLQAFLTFSPAVLQTLGPHSENEDPHMLIMSILPSIRLAVTW